MDKPMKNDDITLWRQDLHDPFSPTVFLASGDRIGMSNGGWMMVYTVECWMKAMEYYNREFHSIIDPNLR